MGYDAASDDGKDNFEPTGASAGLAAPAPVLNPASSPRILPAISSSTAAAACANPIMGSLGGASELVVAGSSATGASSPGAVSNRGSIDKPAMALCGANGSH